MSLRGLWTKDDDDYVLDDAVLDAQDRRISWGALEGEELSSIRLFLFSGATIEMRCSRAHLLASRKIKVLEPWRGPLISGQEPE